jgi:hypothetical protein
MARHSSSIPRDYEGHLALLLCESLLHVLVEQGVLKKKKALDAIDTVLELMGAPDALPQRRGRPADVRAAAELMRMMRASLAAKGRQNRH